MMMDSDHAVETGTVEKLEGHPPGNPLEARTIKIQLGLGERKESRSVDADGMGLCTVVGRNDDGGLQAQSHGSGDEMIHEPISSRTGSSWPAFLAILVNYKHPSQKRRCCG